jgi:hypothetical protein
MWQYIWSYYATLAVINDTLRTTRRGCLTLSTAARGKVILILFRPSVVDVKWIHLSTKISTMSHETKYIKNVMSLYSATATTKIKWSYRLGTKFAFWVGICQCILKNRGIETLSFRTEHILTDFQFHFGEYFYGVGNQSFATFISKSIAVKLNYLFISIIPTLVRSD